jgi:hypothetical protein
MVKKIKKFKLFIGIYWKFLVEILQTKQVCIWSAFSKHGWILLKPGVQVSIGHCIIENEKRITGR